jgi:hypothetical protein
VTSLAPVKRLCQRARQIGVRPDQSREELRYKCSAIAAQFLEKFAQKTELQYHLQM